MAVYLAMSGLSKACSAEANRQALIPFQGGLEAGSHAYGPDTDQPMPMAPLTYKFIYKSKFVMLYQPRIRPNAGESAPRRSAQRRARVKEAKSYNRRP